MPKLRRPSALQRALYKKMYKKKDSETNLNILDNTQTSAHVIKGSHHQGSFIYSAQSRGRQCCPNSYIGILMSILKDPTTWTRQDMDSILREGDNLYCNCPHQQAYFEYDELPRLLSLDSITFESVLGDPISGLHSWNDQTSLQESLLVGCDGHSGCLFTTHSFTIGVMKCNNQYFLFDSHSRNGMGLPVENGTSVCVRFDSVQHLLRHISQLYNITEPEQYDVVSVDAQVLQDVAENNPTDSTADISSHRQNSPEQPEWTESLTNYFTFQEKKQMQKSARDLQHKERIADVRRQNKRKLQAFDNISHNTCAKISAEQDTKEKDRIRKSASRSSLTECERERLREKDRFRKKKSFQALRENEKLLKRNQDKKKKTVTRSIVSEIDKEKTKLSDMQRKRQLRSSLGGVEKETVKETDRQRKRQLRSSLGEEDKETAKGIDRQRKKQSFSALNEAQKQTVREQDKRKKTVTRSSLGEEDKETVKETDRQRKRQSRSSLGEQDKESVKETDRQRKRQSRQSKNLQDGISLFKKETFLSPKFVCACCQRLLYRHSVQKLNLASYKDLSAFSQNHRESFEWICKTCHSYIKQGKTPPMSSVNKLELKSIPEELETLSELEARLVSQRIPFMKLMNLPKGKQKAIFGSVVNVPVDVSETCASLPRSSSTSSGFIPLKLKRKQEYGGHVQYQTVRPHAVEEALCYLKQHNPLYSNVTINDSWQQQFENDDEDLWSALTGADNDDHFEKSGTHSQNHSSELCHSSHSEEMMETIGSETESETVSEICIPTSVITDIQHDKDPRTDLSLTLDTCLQPHDVIPHGNEVFSIAPGEGRVPIGIMQDRDNEVLTFPNLFPTGEFGFDVERSVKLPLRKYFQARLLNCDNRFSSNTKYIFYAQYLTEFKQIHDAINIALRKARQDAGMSVSAGMLKDRSRIADIVRRDQGFQFLQNIRGSPAYCKKIMYDLLAMIRQLGAFTWFVTLSAADLRWPDTISVIASQYNVTLSEEDVLSMSWEDRCHWLRRNPVTAARHFDYRVQLFMNHLMKHDVVGPMKDFLYRVEFQQRGSPHIHMAVWIQNAPTFEKSTDSEIQSFIDRYVSASVPEDEEQKNVVLSYQRHCHSMTCTKTGKTCRFSYPRPPTSETVICREAATSPESATTSENVNVIKPNYASILKRVFTFMSAADNLNQLSTGELLAELDIPSELYLAALKDTKKTNAIIYSREPRDVFINNYNMDILSTWKANMDIQFVSDPFACVMYIASYMTKAEHEMGELLTRVSNEGFDVDLHQQLKRVGRKFLNSREVSAQEAVYRLLSLPLTKSSRQVMYVPTDLDEDRTLLLKPLSVIETLDDEDEDVFQKGYVDRYALRPITLENLCLANFCSDYKVCYSSSDTGEENVDSQSKIALQGGAGYMTKRGTPAICRTHKYSMNKEPEKRYHSLLMLYLPWRSQKDLVHHDGSFFSMYQQEKDTVEANKNQFEHCSEQIDSAVELLEEQGPPEDAWNAIMSESQHQHFSERAEGTSEAEEHSILQPSLHASASRESAALYPTLSSSITPFMMTDNEYATHIRSLNNEQRHVLDMFVNWCFSLRTSKKTGQLPKPIQLFVSGSAGTGKSHLIKALCQTITRLLRCEAEMPDDVTCLLLAPTGTAAHNIHGQTVHHALQLSVYKRTGSDSVSSSALSSLRTKYQSLQCIIIDEVSMLGANDLFRVHKRLADIRGTEDIFGGYSVVCFGDLQQLPPVGQPPVFGLPSNPLARLYGPLWDNMSICVLKQIMRQKDDLAFADLLSRIRSFHDQATEQQEEDIATLKSRLLNHEDLQPPDDALRVYATKANVDAYNQQRLQSIGQPIYRIKAQDASKDLETGRVKVDIPDQPNLTCGLRTHVQVALHSRIMITKNIEVGDGLVNGMQGTVVGFYPAPSQQTQDYTPTFILVELDDPNAGREARQKHPGILQANSRATPIHREEAKFRVGKYQVAEVCRRQFPITLAWACTIHKVQGMTLNNIVISCQSRFNNGQFYVAISRVKSLSGLYFTDFDPRKIIVNKLAAAAENMMKLTRSVESSPIWYPDPNQGSVVVTALNINSLKAHHEDLLHDRSLVSSDIVALSETWLTSNVLASKYQIQGFNMYRCDREQCYKNPMSASLKVKGGVAQYVSSSWFLSSSSHNDIKDIEYLTVNLSSCSNPDDLLSVTVVYKPPFSKVTEFIGHLDQVLSSIPSEARSLVVGDFNVSQDTNSGNIRQLQELFERHHYGSKDLGPTHISGSSIDHVYVKSDLPSSCKVVPVYYSDHAAIQIMLQLGTNE